MTNKFIYENYEGKKLRETKIEKQLGGKIRYFDYSLFTTDINLFHIQIVSSYFLHNVHIA